MSIEIISAIVLATKRHSNIEMILIGQTRNGTRNGTIQSRNMGNMPPVLVVVIVIA